MTRARAAVMLGVGVVALVVFGAGVVMGAGGARRGLGANHARPDGAGSKAEKAPDAEARASVGDVARMVLAFYYPWYGNPDGVGGNGSWVHWEGVDESAKSIACSTDYPALGAYDSQDDATIRAHMAIAKRAGIDALIVSWWGNGTYEDAALARVLNVAKDEGVGVCAYYERCPTDRSAPSIAADLRVLMQHMGNHPAWLKVNGRPVVFVYGRAIDEAGLKVWAQVVRLLAEKDGEPAPVLIADRASSAAAGIFDGTHVYNPAGDIRRDVPSRFADVDAWARDACRFWVGVAREQGKVATATVIPGYDDTKIRTPGLRVERGDGALYRTMWEAAIEASPDWVLICSFNEWHEGSEIEPSVEYGEKYVEMTREFADRFHAEKK